MTTRAELVAEARSWLGTPWVHQGRMKGVAGDCVALVTMTGKAKGLTTFDITDYVRKPDGVALLALLRRYLIEIPVAQMQPGDVLCFVFNRIPHHIGVAGDYRGEGGGLSVIHGDNSATQMVVEHRLDERWRARICAAFKYPGIEP